MPNRSSYKYTPFYCEENVWHLVRNKHFHKYERYVVFISNHLRKVFFLNQQAGDEYGGILWDYHVILLTFNEKWYVWDMDTRLSFPCELEHYLDSTFGYTDGEKGEWVHPRYTLEVIQSYRPLFKLIEARVYSTRFASNRTHMLDERGNYRNPPPPWPMIHPRRVNTLRYFIDMSNEAFGPVLTQSELLLLLNTTDDYPETSGS